VKTQWTVRARILGIYVIAAFVVLLIPIAYTFLFSFNETTRTNITWNGFTIENWLTVCEQPEVCVAFGNSILVGFVATIIATTLGTMIALALVRYQFKARGSISLLLFLPMATPEVVIGAGLAAQFLTMGVAKGLGVVTVRARALSLDPSIEEAGRDLYGSPRQVFWRITFPLLLPGIIAAALLSFSLSFDDFIITYFTSGSVQTFPVYIYVAAQRGIPPQANVIASAVFLLAIIGTLAYGIVNARRAAVRRGR
jgi:spermidine/putrescine transport system permease protein